MRRLVVALASVALVALATAPAQARVRVGLLSCRVAPGVSFIVGSQKGLRCVYRSVSGWRESYDGRISRVGLDIGFTSGGRLAWAVYAPSRPGRGALAGGYGGAGAEATVGGGVGANVLVGGFRHSIMLQPISVGAQTGADLAVAVTGLELERAR
jgi:hypothetical protein